MNNKIIAGVVIGVVVVAGWGIYLATRYKSATESSISGANITSTQNNQTTPPASTSSSQSLRDIMAQGPQKCSYQDGTNTGVVYTNNGRSRMDFSVNVGGQTMGTHSIIDGDTYYSWYDGQPSGFKFSLSQTGAVNPAQAFDMNKSLDYNCAPWSVDSSLFSPPSNITFVDYNSFTPPTK